MRGYAFRTTYNYGKPQHLSYAIVFLWKTLTQKKNKFMVRNVHAWCLIFPGVPDDVHAGTVVVRYASYKTFSRINTREAVTTYVQVTFLQRNNSLQAASCTRMTGTYMQNPDHFKNSGKSGKFSPKTCRTEFPGISGNFFRGFLGIPEISREFFRKFGVFPRTRAAEQDTHR